MWKIFNYMWSSNKPLVFQKLLEIMLEKSLAIVLETGADFPLKFTPA